MAFGLCFLSLAFLQLVIWTGSSAAAGANAHHSLPGPYQGLRSDVERVKASTTTANLRTLNGKLRQGGVYVIGRITHDTVAGLERELGLCRSLQLEVVFYALDNVHYYPQVIVRQTRGDARCVPEPLFPEEKNRLPFPGLPEEMGRVIIEQVLKESPRDFLELRHVSRAWRVALRALRRKVLEKFEARDGDLLTDEHLAFVSDILQVQYRPEVAYRVVEEYMAGTGGQFRKLGGWLDSRHDKRKAKIGQMLLKDHYPLARLASARKLISSDFSPDLPYIPSTARLVDEGPEHWALSQIILGLVAGVELGGIIIRNEWWHLKSTLTALVVVYTALWVVRVTHKLLPKKWLLFEMPLEVCYARTTWHRRMAYFVASICLSAIYLSMATFLSVMVCLCLS